MGLIMQEGKFVSRDEVARTETPCSTDTWHPVSHIDVINAVTEVVKTHDWEIEGEKFGLARFFGGVVGGGDCPELKPSAMPLQACAAQMGHTPAPGDWMVGDSWTDMRCAEAAGVSGAFCKFGFGRLNDAPTTAVLDRFDDLLRFANPRTGA